MKKLKLTKQQKEDIGIGPLTLTKEHKKLIEKWFKINGPDYTCCTKQANNYLTTPINPIKFHSLIIDDLDYCERFIKATNKYIMKLVQIEKKKGNDFF